MKRWMICLLLAVLLCSGCFAASAAFAPTKPAREAVLYQSLAPTASPARLQSIPLALDAPHPHAAREHAAPALPVPQLDSAESAQLVRILPEQIDALLCGLAAGAAPQA